LKRQRTFDENGKFNNFGEGRNDLKIVAKTNRYQADFARLCRIKDKLSGYRTCFGAEVYMPLDYESQPWQDIFRISVDWKNEGEGLGL